MPAISAAMTGGTVVCDEGHTGNASCRATPPSHDSRFLPRYVFSRAGGGDSKKLRYETAGNRKAGFDDSRSFGKLRAAWHFYPAAHARRSAQDRRLLARGQLSFHRPDLSVRKSASPRTAENRAHQAAATRTLGDHARAELHLRPFQSPDQELRSECHLPCRPRPRRARNGREYLLGGHLQRVLSEHRSKRRGPTEAVQAVFLSRWNSEPCGARNSWLHPRRWRTGLFDRARLWCGVRQPRPARMLRGGRRRGGNRTTGHQLALH